MHERPLSPSTIFGIEFEPESGYFSRRHTRHNIEDDKNVPYRPPHPQHIPSSFEVAQANARIADQMVKFAKLKIKMAELHAKLTEMIGDMLRLAQQCNSALQAARNDLSFIAGTCSTWKCVEPWTHVPLQ